MFRKLLIIGSILMAAAPRAQSQVLAGDSIRVRSAAQPGWLYGKVTAQDGAGSLVVRTAGGVELIQPWNIVRLDRWERKDKGKELTIATVAGIATGTVAYLLQPSSLRTVGQGCVITASGSLCTSRTESGRPGSLATFQLLGGAGGAVVGAVGLILVPGTWHVALRR